MNPGGILYLNHTKTKVTRVSDCGIWIELIGRGSFLKDLIGKKITVDDERFEINLIKNKRAFLVKSL